MSLAEQVKTAEALGFNPNKKTNMCGIAKLKNRLKDEPAEIKALDKMIADRQGWPSKLLATVMAEEGYGEFATIHILQRHRARECKCGKI